MSADLRAIGAQTDGGPKKQRNSGMDILRILAMLFICALHCDERGLGVHVGVDAVSQGVHAMWMNVVLMGVNLFMLITGYCCIGASWRLSRYVSMYFQVAFYSVGFMVLMHVLPFESHEWMWEVIMKRCMDLPLAGGYWYFTVYTGLFFIMPFLNKLICSLSKKQLRLLVLACVFAFSFLNIGGGKWIAQGGMNLIWMMGCYIMGAYIRLEEVRIKPIISLLGFVVLIIASAVLKEFVPSLARDYTSPVFLGACVCLVFFFSQIRIKHEGVRAMLAWVSTFAFGVYLFHCHHLTWGVSSKIILRMGFAIDFAWWGWVMIPVAIYAMGTCVDWGRSCLFKWVGINRLSERLSAAAADVVNKWIH